jgi:hypothetical protein
MSEEQLAELIRAIKLEYSKLLTWNGREQARHDLELSIRAAVSKAVMHVDDFHRKYSSNQITLCDFLNGVRELDY